MFNRISHWRPVRKVAAVIWLGLLATAGAGLDAAGAINWQAELVDKLGPWAVPAALGLGSLFAFLRRAIPDEQPGLPIPVTDEEPAIPDGP